MTQDEFLTKLFSLYAASFSRGNGQAWLDAYKKALSPNLDYDKLYEYLLYNYTDSSAPKPAYLVRHAEYKQEYKTNDEPEVWETIIVQKGKQIYEYGVKLSNYINDIKYFDKEGMNIIKLKFCDKNCQRCQYNHVCLTAKEKRA